MSDYNVEQARLEEVIELRHIVVRPNQARSSCYYPEDTYKNTIHFVAKTGNELGKIGTETGNEIIGSASIYKEKHPDFSLKQSWRVRGMVVLPEFQGQGIGAQLLETCINHAIKMKGDVIWCNARIDAVKFYKQSGFKIIGDEFELPDIGPHFLLAKNLGIHIGQTRFANIAKKLLGRSKPEGVPIPQPKIKH
ncbi:MAG: GNAT family N-acetyltransferase [Proteobacteria bacterium]|nr:GNAT family N-acetyltransferase [Pseudomonadota bacterium]